MTMSQHRIRVPLLLVLGVFPILLGAVPTQETYDFLDEDSDHRVTLQGDRVTALYGTVLDTDSDQQTTTQEFVEDFLDDNGDALGVTGATFSYVDDVAVASSTFKVFTYVQTIESLPVHGTVVKVPVLLGATEKIGMVSAYLVEEPGSSLPSDVYTAAQAIAAVSGDANWDHLTFTSSANAVKVIYKSEAGTYHRAWSFYGWDELEMWMFFVDTSSNELVGVEDQVLTGDVDVTVTADVTDCCSADSATNPPSQDVALEGVQVVLDDITTCDADEITWCSTDITDANGEKTLSFTAPAPDQVAASLTGDWVTVFDCQGEMVGASPGPEIPVLCEDTTNCDASSCDDVTLDFVEDADADLGPAAANTFLVVQETHDWFADLMDDSSIIDEQVKAFVNVGGASSGYGCQAYMIPSLDPATMAYFIEPERCRNSANHTIISHEYGHFIVYEFLGLYDFNFHEGAADIISMLMWDEPCGGKDWLLQSVWENRECTRHMDAMEDSSVDYGGFFINDDCPAEGCEVQLGDPRCSGTPHCRGLALASAFWDLRKQLLYCSDDDTVSCNEVDGCDFGTCSGGTCTGNAEVSCSTNEDCDLGTCIDLATEELFVDFLHITDGHIGESNLAQVLLADDMVNGSDADLTNGTPNGCEIICAFVGKEAENMCDMDSSYFTCNCEEEGHGWACPVLGASGDGSVEVTWYGPSGDPTEGTDYDVDYETSPPSVTLKTTKSGIDVVEQWRILRYFDGWCDGGTNDGMRCNDDDDCPSGTCKGVCDGGTADGDPCTSSATCGGGTCIEDRTVLPLGTIRADWDEVSNNNIIVRLGTQTDTTGSVGVVEIDPQDASKYSNLIFNIYGNVEGRAKCTADSSDDGGRVSGYIAGFINLLEAQAIGIGADTAGTLETSYPVDLRLDEFPSGSKLDSATIHYKMLVDGELDGTVELDRLEGTIVVDGTGESAGDILVDGDIKMPISGQRSIEIAGDFSGSIIADADEDGDGDILSPIIVDGVFNGDICAANINPENGYDGLPAVIKGTGHIETFGPDWTICEVRGCKCNDATSCASVDCNDNDIHDTCDIADCSSDPDCGDCNYNGIPDGCDLDDCSSEEWCDDCDTNDFLDECDLNPRDPDGDTYVDTDCDDDEIPDSCQLSGDDANSDGVPDSCGTAVNAPNVRHQVRKNRYISFEPTIDTTTPALHGVCDDESRCSVTAQNCVDESTCVDDEEIAFKVELTEMKRCDNDRRRACDDAGDCPYVCDNDPDVVCTSSAQCGAGTCLDDPSCDNHEDVGTVWYVQEPMQASACTGMSTSNLCTDEDWYSELDSSVYYFNWSELGLELNTLHVGDCEIVSVATYEVSACWQTASGMACGTPYEVGTISLPTSEGHFFGDVVGTGIVDALPPAVGYTGPDGYVNVTDVQACIQTMEGVTSKSVPMTWVDLHGLGSGSLDDGCPPNYILNVADYQRILLGMEGWMYTELADQIDPSDCPANDDWTAPQGTAVEFSVIASEEFIDPEEPVEFEVYIDPVDDFSAYNIALDITGGTSGSLTLVNITIDTDHEDYVFGSSSTSSSINLSEGRVSNALNSGSVDVTSAAYLATFTYEPTGGATGGFNIEVLEDENISFINDEDGLFVLTDVGDTEVIGVGIDCFDAGDCAPITCKTASCTDNECSYANQSQGTSCDDGLFCTKTDECDGSGNCIGSGAKCPPFNPTCCEEGDYCACSTCQCAGQ